MQKLHIVLSCTARKRASEPEYPRLRSVSRSQIPDRVRQWAALVSAAPRQCVAADLYAGEYWQTGMELASCAAASRQVGVSAISAGLGLVGIRDEVPMYGATLAARHPDSVLTSLGPASPRQVRRLWWDELTRADVLGRDGPRRLVDLGEDGAEPTVMVCVGRNYLDAVVTDLTALAERLGDPERMLVFASGKPLAGLEECWVAVSGSLRLALGGSLSSTSLRAAKVVLAELGALPPDADKARSIVAALTAAAGELPSFARERQHDDVILGWILDYLAEDPHTTETAALRRYRDDGKACEQARFGRLFDDAREMAN